MAIGFGIQKTEISLGIRMWYSIRKDVQGLADEEEHFGEG